MSQLHFYRSGSPKWRSSGSDHAKNHFFVAKTMILLIFCVFVLYDIAIHLAKENLFSLTGDELKKSKVSALFPYFLRVFTKISIFLDDKISFKKNEKKTIRKRKFFPFFSYGSDFENFLSPGRNFHWKNLFLTSSLPLKWSKNRLLGGSSILKPNPERIVEIQEHMSCSEFYYGFNGANTRFVSPTVWEIFGY